MPNQNYIVTIITKMANDTVNFYDRTILQRSISQVKKMPERDTPNGQYIIITDVSDRQFWFDVWSVVDVDGTAYLALDITDPDIDALYQTRINNIYAQLCDNVFRGCCDTGGTGSYDVVSGTATGTDTYLLAGIPPQTSYSENRLYRVEFTNANSGASTLNIDGIGAAAIIHRDGSALSAGDIPANSVGILAYDGVSFQLMSVAASGSGTIISATAILNFGNEQDFVLSTILNASITNANFKGASFLNSETTETSLDDFTLNGVYFNVENILDNVSFDIRASAVNNASGNYTTKYIISI